LSTRASAADILGPAGRAAQRVVHITTLPDACV
jgi:hypothetical protein